MKKIGIISELNLMNVNYGNRLQAFALNKYLTDNYKDYATYSIILDSKQCFKITKFSLKHNLAIYLRSFLIKRKRRNINESFKLRMNLCNDFTKRNIPLLDENFKFNHIANTDYDIFIVGSDVVWSQNNYGINRIKFLDFNIKKSLIKMSYAASFGRDYIPSNNVNSIVNYLSSFSGISVREKSSVKMLNNIGLKNVVHVCDPTLLLSNNQWKSFETNPKLSDNKYIFVYLLGKNKLQRNFISNFAKENNLLVINIPNANGINESIDIEFGDIQYDNCSPENWLWLIHNAEYVFTDSFHGIVFSTIFEKKFIALKRDTKVDKNNRIIDYLNTIEQSDKLVSVNDCDISSLKWNYDVINKKLNSFKKNSENYLKELLK